MFDDSMYCGCSFFRFEGDVMFVFVFKFVYFFWNDVVFFVSGLFEKCNVFEDWGVNFVVFVMMGKFMIGCFKLLLSGCLDW